MTITAVTLVVLGVVLLVFGAECLVRGASRFASMLGVSPLIIGLTIVAFGTSAPELAVSIRAAFGGQADLALGNVVGSNICNVLLILGASSLVAPLVVAQQLVRLDVPIMIGVSALMLFFGLDGTISSSDGVILFTGGLVYTVFLLVQSRREKDQGVQDEYAQEYGPHPFSWRKVGKNAFLFVSGSVTLVAGSQFLVKGAVDIATALGASALVIGLTIVALGTSLPELATSMVASLRGERDIAVGNVVGSNIFNILVVLGATSAIAPGGIQISSAALSFDIPVMVAVAVMCFPIFFSGNLVSRWEGALLLSYYLAYILYLFLESSNHSSSEALGSVLKFVIVPLTILALSLMTWQSRQSRQKGRGIEDRG
ncbi:MAG: calcium/sodium antiporter [Cyanobacteria bacterium P01_D01_bin.44]